MIPFYLYGFMMTILLCVYFWLKGEFSGELCFYYLTGLFNGRGKQLANTDLWFLPSLFLTSIVAYVLLIKQRASNISLVLTLLAAVALTYLTDREGNSLYSINTVPPALFFFLSGYIYKKIDISLQDWKKIFLFFFFVLVIYSISYFHYHQTIDIGANYYGKSILLMFVNGLIGTFFIIFFSRKMNQNSYLEYIGKISLYIFIFHQIFVPMTDYINTLLNIDKHFLIIGTIKLFGSIAIYEWGIKPLKKKYYFL